MLTIPFTPSGGKTANDLRFLILSPCCAATATKRLFRDFCIRISPKISLPMLILDALMSKLQEESALADSFWSLAILTEERLGLRGPSSVKPQERRAGLR